MQLSKSLRHKKPFDKRAKGFFLHGECTGYDSAIIPRRVHLQIPVYSQKQGRDYLLQT